jgi:hypothetical protein
VSYLLEDSKMFKKISQQLVTKQQLEGIIKAWGTDSRVPPKGKKEIVSWPLVNEFAELTYTDKVADSGKRLYSIECFRATIDERNE